jgi:hypothetical protein
MDTAQQHRLAELQAKAAGPGLSDEEADELGKLYAADEGASYANAGSAGDAEELDEEAKQQQIRDEQMAKAQWKDMDQKRSRISFKEGGVEKG